VVVSVDPVIAAALAEDVGDGDATSNSLFAPDEVCEALVLVKESGVVCGLEVAREVFQALDPRAEFEPLLAEGTLVAGRTEVARVRGTARAILTGERTALNLLGRACGVATLARRYADALAGTGTVLLDTRKTTPGLRALEKYATRCGGATNHRVGLYDAVLIKDNHLALVGSIAEAVRRARASGLPVQVECDTLDQLREALGAGADSILLDNMSLAELREAVALTAGRATLEASGGVNLDTIRSIAETGVDFVSVGALTHSARSLDVSLEVSP
jgi:nicotinate-nucleotide pyrophosphorylase (carboxylating)